MKFIPVEQSSLKWGLTDVDFITTHDLFIGFGNKMRSNVADTRERDQDKDPERRHIALVHLAKIATGITENGKGGLL